jgi:hypothetical protein
LKIISWFRNEILWSQDGHRGRTLQELPGKASAGFVGDEDLVKDSVTAKKDGAVVAWLHYLGGMNQ